MGIIEEATAPITREDVLSFLANGILAPSQHNTQPWSFTINDEGTLAIVIDYEKRLPVADPNSTNLLISVGCLIYNIELTARSAGYETQIGFSDFELSQQKILLTFNKGAEISLLPNDQARLNAIPTRRSHKGDYVHKVLKQNELNLLAIEDTNGLKVLHLTTTEVISKVSSKLTEATHYWFLNNAFRNELRNWIRVGIDSDGMPGASMGFSNVQTWVLKNILLRYRFNAKIIKKREEAILNNAALIGMIFSENSKITPSTLINTGRVYQQISLSAQSIGASSVPMTAAVEKQDTKLDLEKQYGDNKELLMVFRIGFPDKLLGKTARKNLKNLLRYK